MERKMTFIHTDVLDAGGYPNDCPFSSKRAGKTLAVMESLGLTEYTNIEIVPPEPLQRSEMLTFHTAEYLDVLDAVGRGDHDFKALKMGIGTPDCPVFRGLGEFSALAAAGSVTGARLLLEKKTDIAVNLSGGFHHAGSANSAGFCYVNDVVLAAKEMAAAGKRVMVVDVDAHHLDAVQDAFYESDEVITVSLHESGDTLFPGTGYLHETGSGKGEGYAINLPLPVGTYDAIYIEAFNKVVIPAIEKFTPDVLIVELGMDGLSGDPMAHLNLTNNAYADMVDKLYQQNLPMLVVGGGGYSVKDTVRSWALCCGVLLEGGQDDLLMNAGMGGVMLQNNAWFGGLRDHTLLSHSGYRDKVDQQIRENIRSIQKHFDL